VTSDDLVARFATPARETLREPQRHPPVVSLCAKWGSIEVTPKQRAGRSAWRDGNLDD